MKTSEWTAALRSGQYEQAQNSLCDRGAFCCLGVLAEVAGVPKRESVVPEDAEITDIIYDFTLPDGEIESQRYSLPLALHDHFLEDLDLSMKLPDELVEIGGDKSHFSASTLHSRLMSLNDEGFTFEQIADYIGRVRAGG